MTRGTVQRLGGEFVEGSAPELAVAVCERVVQPVVDQVAVAFGAEGVAAFYTALVAHTLGRARMTLGADVAVAIGECARRAMQEHEGTVGGRSAHGGH